MMSRDKTIEQIVDDFTITPPKGEFIPICHKFIENIDMLKEEIEKALKKENTKFIYKILKEIADNSDSKIKIIVDGEDTIIFN